MATRIILVLALSALIITPALAQTPPPTQPPAQPPAATTPPAATPPPATSNPISAVPEILTPTQNATLGARALIEKVIHSDKNALPSPEWLSNRSAAFVGYMTLSIIGGFSGLGESMAKGPQKVKMEQVGHLVRVVEMKYNISPDKDLSDAAMSRLEKNGRPFFADVCAAVTQISKILPNSSPTPSKNSISGQFPNSIDDYTFTPVSPTKVKIVAKGHADQPLSAVLEDGQWRLDFGGLEDMEKESGTKPSGTH